MKMKKTPNKKLIGLFTLTGIALFAFFILTFLSDRIFIKQKDLIVLYFTESVNGLNIGAPVVLKGVEIGRVIKIDLEMDMATMTFQTPVFIRLTSNQIFKISGAQEVKDKPAFLKMLVEKGLRAKLTTLNILTGQLMIALSLSPDTQAVFRNTDKNLDIVEIPTILSSTGELLKGLQELPIKESFFRLNGFLETLNTYSPQVMKQLADLTKKMNAFADSLNGAQTMTQINKTLKEISAAASSLRNFADYIERNPETLLRGKRKGY
jgi:paraquat-inducible protein B